MRLATRAYRPGAYAGRVVFVRPEQPGANDPVPVWQRAVKGELVLETSPGDHLSIIKDANAVALARVMSRHLSGAGSAQAGT
jgi:thioesterase domain-containing protein